MKKALPIFIIEIIISVLFACLNNDFIVNYDFFTMFGLGNLLSGLGGCLIALILAIAGNESSKSFFIASGLILLAGFLTCSIFPLK